MKDNSTQEVKEKYKKLKLKKEKNKINIDSLTALEILENYCNSF